MMRRLLVPGVLALLVEAQKAGQVIPEVHPTLSWKRCSRDDATGAAACATVAGKVVVDAEKRWVRAADGFANCYTGNSWDAGRCPTNDACTAACVIEGVDAAGLRDQFGVVASGDRLSQRRVTQHAFGTNSDSRLFLLEAGEERYQTFTLLGNELAFDVDLSAVQCSVNSALYFVAMDADGGKARHPTNKAGARYGTGYCDASCPRTNKFVGGKANVEGWSVLDENSGEGSFGACCSEFDVWNSNAHSFSMIAKPCVDVDYEVCSHGECNALDPRSPQPGQLLCDRTGCDYNPYRLGNTTFYGKGKTVNTDKKITVVTRFEEDEVTQFFIQDGKRIEAPKPNHPGFPDESGISAGHCAALPPNFGDPEHFGQVGGYARHNEALRRPMVLALSISKDHWANNLWLDSVYPPQRDGPGAERGPCPSNQGGPGLPWIEVDDSRVAWSNIRFGPIGTTV
ncbi:exoglucanase 1 protein [Colletotrichum tabaci]|uniref:Glucanase n=1 Tax=Colletotrichum tabaci TaxID=1209068 RepID=A0AAV9T9D6_9PEZI